MSACREMEGLIAASVYDDLTKAERSVLANHLEGCAACRADQASFMALREAIPVEAVEWAGDLRPTLLAALPERERETGRNGAGTAWGWRIARFAIPAAAALAVVFAIDQFAGREAALPPVVAPAKSPLMASIEESNQLTGDRNFTGAYLALAEGLKAEPESSRPEDIAYALQRMGEIAFLELRWYPEAYDAYRALREEHFAAFRSTEDNILRLEILSDARGPAADFAALQELDRAKNTGDFEAFERVAARHAGSSIATLATTEMARALGGGETTLEGYEQALAKCTDPVAADQVRLEMAARLRGDSEQLSRTRELLEAVVANGHDVLASRAQTSLDELDSGDSR